MLRNSLHLLSIFLFWMAYFLLERLLFVLYNLSDFKRIMSEVPKTFWYGLRMDASMAAYICAIPLLCYIFHICIPKFRIPPVLTRIYFFLILFLCSFLTVLNLNIYREWGTKLPYRVISTFFESPKEAMVSSESAPLLLSFSLIAGLFLIGAWGIHRLLRRGKDLKGHALLGPKIAWSILCIFVLFFIMRSGLQTTPLNPSMAYFSATPILNHAAVNTEWNLMDDMLHAGSTGKNPYHYMDPEEARQRIAPYINQFHSSPDTILNTSKPNVVLIILESFTAELIESLGGEKGITPHMETLIDEGILFNNIYATGDRTDKGMIAIMSGFPSQATQSIIKNVNKLEKLPALGTSFKQAGYHTSFFYGGESEFYNIKSFMLSHSIDRVIDRHSFPREQTNSKWGAFDHLTFQKQIDSLEGAAEPFFSVLLTLSNHEPFEVPGTHHFGSDGDANLFRSTAFYTDSALWDYFQKAKTRDWYANTLFVLIADHGHRLPSNTKASYTPQRYHIPLLFYGEPIKTALRGTQITKLGNQTDLASTLLGSLGMDTQAFYWSRNILSPETRPFAFFDWDNGLGVMLEDQRLSFDQVGKRIIEADPDPENGETLKLGQAYMQVIYEQFLDL